MDEGNLAVGAAEAAVRRLLAVRTARVEGAGRKH